MYHTASAAPASDSPCAVSCGAMVAAASGRPTPEPRVASRGLAGRGAGGNETPLGAPQPALASPSRLRLGADGAARCGVRQRAHDARKLNKATPPERAGKFVKSFISSVSRPGCARPVHVHALLCAIARLSGCFIY